ncbi:MAG: class I SAM-dependent methyltransferase [archaeon]|nr:class I SAM-dependent methyltransferase [archaeon]
MNLEKEYENQQKWRYWEQYLEHIPYNENDIVVDLGCSVGNVSRLFSKRVKKVIGVDLNRDFIDYCKAKSQQNEKFIYCDISNFDVNLVDQLSGVWASFSLSYLKHPSKVIGAIYTAIKNGGWIALLDVSCFISGNMFKNCAYYQSVRDFELESYKSGKYDFIFSSKMRDLLINSGFEIVYQNNNVTDSELNFDGAVSGEILQNWKARLTRLKGMQRIFGSEYNDVCNEIITSLSSSNHEKRGNVKFIIAKKI